MRYQTAVAAAACLAHVHAAPSFLGDLEAGIEGAFNGLGGFSVGQVQNPNPILKSLPEIYKSAFVKYGVTIPNFILEAIQWLEGEAAASQSGSVTASPTSLDTEYLCPVQIGTPPQTLHLDFDTGSSDLWVFSTLLPPADQGSHTLYNNQSSSTSRVRQGETWSISYQDGSGASGVVFGDKVAIGAVTATHQAVEAATSVSSSFATGVNDGLVGLAAKSINTAKPKQVNTFFGNVQKSLPAKLFTATLKHQAPGSYDFGYLDSSKYTGAITYVPIVHNSGRQGFYEFAASGYAIGGGSVVSTPLEAIADTGTTLLYMPAAVVKAYYASVPRSQNSPLVGGYVFPCNSNLPNLGIQIGGATHYVPGAYINFSPAYSFLGTDFCFGGLQVNTGLPFSIFGDVFLKSVYAVFDVGNNRMGFASQA